MSSGVALFALSTLAVLGALWALLVHGLRRTY